MQPISIWKDDWELDNLPDHPPMLDLLLKDNNVYGGRQAYLLLARYEVLLVRHLYNEGDLVSLVNNQLIDDERTLLVVTSEEMQSQLISLGLSKDKIAVHRTKHSSREGFILDSLVWLSSHARPLHTLPSFTNSSGVRTPTKTNIRAGKTTGQQHPRLDWLYLDGSFQAHNALSQIYYDFAHNLIEDKTLQFNFLAKLSNEKFVSHPVSWSWM